MVSETVLKSGIEWLAEFSRERRQARAKSRPTIYFRNDGSSYEFDVTRTGHKPPKVWIMACRPGWTRNAQPKKWTSEVLRPVRHPDQFVTHLMEMQNHRCYICGRAFSGMKRSEDGIMTMQAKSPTRDHVLPRALGGKDQHNLLIAHLLCNQEKANRMPTACEILLRDFIHLDLGGHYLLNIFTAEEIHSQQVKKRV